MAQKGQNELDARLRRAADDLDEAVRVPTSKRKGCTRYRRIRGASAASRTRAGSLERERSPCTRLWSRAAPKGATPTGTSRTHTLASSSVFHHKRFHLSGITRGIRKHGRALSFRPANPPARATFS
jgi:hypothetical protein